jgi:hypothetical protein
MGDKSRDRDWDRDDHKRPDSGGDDFGKRDKGDGFPGREEDTLPDREGPPRK